MVVSPNPMNHFSTAPRIRMPFYSDSVGRWRSVHFAKSVAQLVPNRFRHRSSSSRRTISKICLYASMSPAKDLISANTCMASTGRRASTCRCSCRISLRKSLASLALRATPRRRVYPRFKGIALAFLQFCCCQSDRSLLLPRCVHVSDCQVLQFDEALPSPLMGMRREVPRPMLVASFVTSYIDDDRFDSDSVSIRCLD